MNYKNLFLIVLLALIFFVSNGCPAPVFLIGGAAGAGSVAYVG